MEIITSFPNFSGSTKVMTSQRRFIRKYYKNQAVRMDKGKKRGQIYKRQMNNAGLEMQQKKKTTKKKTPS